MAHLFVTSAAERDYTEALCWYAERSLQVAEGFELAIDEAFAMIAAEPERFPICDLRHRYYFLNRFPYQIIYRIQHGEVWIIAIAHTSRNDAFFGKAIMLPSEHLGIPPEEIAVIVVDHGSRRNESNQLLLDVVDAYRQSSQWSIVEPAHMELAEPSIASAFATCVGKGAELVIVFPYFLAPGRHWHEDIPRLAAEAAEPHPGVRHLVTAPLGLHPLLLQVIQERIATCLNRVVDAGDSCELCSDSTGCTLLPPKS